MEPEIDSVKKQFIEVGSIIFVNETYGYPNINPTLKLTKDEVLNACREGLLTLCGKLFRSSVDEKARIDVQLKYINHVCDVIAIFPEGSSLTRDDIIGNLCRFSKSELVPNSYSVN